MESTTERERTMARLKRIANEMERLEAAEPTARENEIAGQYPRMPRERILRMVAAEIADKETN